MIRWPAILVALTGPAAAQTAIPDPAVTPGAVRTTDAADVCSRGTRELRHMTRERSDRITVEYGLPRGRHPGADSDANLWPEPRVALDPEWSAERKDQLEGKLRALVCGGKLDISVAQKAVADDWTEALLRYLHFVPFLGENPFAVDFGGELGRGAQDP